MNCKAKLNLPAAALLYAVLITACAEPPAERPIDKSVAPGRIVKKPSSSLRHTAIFDYEDFGPHVMAYELIGDDWNRWKNEGHELPDDVEIKVVVYKGVSLAEVKNAYPIIRGMSDYRYVEYDSALLFLDRRIKELEGFKREKSQADSVKTWEELIDRLDNTKAAITTSLT
jgi:hypothetical protein